MAQRLTRRERVVLAGSVHPQRREVVQTYVSPRDMDLVTGTGGTGTLTGFVGDACCGISAATRKPLPGAAVSLTGTSYSAQTDATGTYSFTVPAGSYTPRATMAGYDPADHTSLGAGYPATLSVAAGATQWGSILLQRTAAVVTAPVVKITQPADGATLLATPASVTGTVSEAALSSVRINGQTVSASNGAFTGSVSLTAGANAITVEASNAGGTGSATVGVTYAPTPGAPPPAAHLRVDSPGDGSTVNLDSVLVSGVAEVPGLKALKINDEQVDFNGSGAFGVEVPLRPGANQLVITVSAAGGVTVTATVHVAYSPVTLASTGCSGAAPADLIAFLMFGLFSLRPRRR